MPKLKVPGEKHDCPAHKVLVPPSKKPRNDGKVDCSPLCGAFYHKFGCSEDEVRRAQVGLHWSRDSPAILQAEFEGFPMEGLPHLQLLNWADADSRPSSPMASSSSTSSSSSPPSPSSSSSSSSSPSSPPAPLHRPPFSGQLRKRGVRCMQCPACLCKDDCGKCVNCK